MDQVGMILDKVISGHIKRDAEGNMRVDDEDGLLKAIDRVFKGVSAKYGIVRYNIAIQQTTAGGGGGAPGAVVDAILGDAAQRRAMLQAPVTCPYCGRSFEPAPKRLNTGPGIIDAEYSDTTEDGE